MKKLLATVFALTCILTLARSAHADIGTIFGVGDDLTVQGTDGTYADADVEIYGLTVLGPTRPGSTRITGAMPGSLIVTGSLEVSGAAYLPALGNILPSDLSGNGARILRVNTAGTALEYQSVAELISGSGDVSNLTVPIWNSTDKKYVNSAITQDDFGAVTKVMISKNVVMDQKLTVTGNTDLTGKLTAHDSATFITTVTVQGVSQLGDVAADDGVGINTPAVPGVALKVVGDDVAPQAYTAQFYSGANLAAWIIKK